MGRVSGQQQTGVVQGVASRDTEVSHRCVRAADSSTARELRNTNRCTRICDESANRNEPVADFKHGEIDVGITTYECHSGFIHEHKTGFHGLP